MLTGVQTPITVLLLVSIVMVSGYILFASPRLIDRLSFRPARVGKEPYRYITGGFVHVSLTHLLFNAVTLYFFGPPLEVLLGSGSFLILYFGSLLCAHGLTHIRYQGSHMYSAVGASGAVSGVLMSYVLFDPYDLIYFFGILPVPAILFAVIFIAGSIYAAKSGSSDGIAHEAHLGGCIGGLLLTVILQPNVVPLFLDKLL